MNSYYLRAVSRDEIVQIGHDLGLLVTDEAGTRGIDARVAWDEIGPLTAPTGQLDEDGQPVLAVITDEAGAPLWHANLYLQGTLADWAQARLEEAMAAGDSARAELIAQHIANSAQYFPVDEQGRPRAPNNPRRVLWSEA